MVETDSIVRITAVLDALEIARSSWYHKPEMAGLGEGGEGEAG